METNQQNSNNQNENETTLGTRDSNPNAMPLLRKRSSLKQRSSLKDGGFNFPNNKLALKRRITWNEDVDLEEGEKKSEKSYSDSKTRFSSAVILLKILYFY